MTNKDSNKFEGVKGYGDLPDSTAKDAKIISNDKSEEKDKENNINDKENNQS